MNDKDYEARAQAHIAAIKKSSKAMVEDAVVRAMHKVMAEFEAKSDERLMEPPTEFFTHCVDQPYDWSEWVCPEPKSYLFKCCDCGLVHEAEFGVVRYKLETEREDCDMVDDPNLQAVFRMRRSEQWSPADMAHRAGGLTMEQPAQQQEPVAYGMLDTQLGQGGRMMMVRLDKGQDGCTLPLYTSPQPAPRKPLTHEQRVDLLAKFEAHKHEWHAPAILIDMVEAAHGIGEKK